ncbi:NAD-dependent epimerase/dehydratase family protein [uncultured Jatrophihabitans sp.]|uniref:NAD-dependent epimerase/dehydratase family protein n=1 Tax=uncultured Jatrophihabitans sp. TaxID=1610747 RepID=UPI0035CB4E25
MARVLVLGGGGFLGFHVVDAAVRDGHEVTVLSRSGRAPRDGVEVLTGDRQGDLDALRGGRWDAVVDTFTDTDPGAPAVRRTAELLSGSAGLYCYVSGMSVYAPDGPQVPDESAPVRRAGVEPDDDPLQERSLAKLAAEDAVHDVFDGPVLVPRVGIMVGPRDPSQRFSWWPMRCYRALTGAAPDTVPAPGAPDRSVQYSDTRDIAAWMVTMATQQHAGTFNTVGPLRADPLRDVLQQCLDAARDVAGPRAVRNDVRWRWLTDEDALRGALRDVDEEGRPLWYPEDQIPQRAIDSAAAHRAGLRFRPAGQTARETLTWLLQQDQQPLASFDEP